MILIDPQCEKTGKVLKVNNNIYSCTLNQTNIRVNNNKFYIMQIIKSVNSYIFYRRYGRIGNDGIKLYDIYTDEYVAINNFEKLFKLKTGNNWCNRKDFVKKNKKYFLTEVSYEEELKDVNEDNKTIPKSKLSKDIQDLLLMISDVNMMKNTLVELDIDTNKLPLDKINKSQLKKANELLTEINQKLVNNDTLDIEELSSLYYTYIPYSCGRNRPPLINTNEMIAKYTQIIEDLRNIVVNVKIPKKIGKDINPLDNIYKEIKTKIKPLNKKSHTYNCIERYFTNTHTPPPNFKLKLLNVYKIFSNCAHEL